MVAAAATNCVYQLTLHLLLFLPRLQLEGLRVLSEEDDEEMRRMAKEESVVLQQEVG